MSKKTLNAEEYDRLIDTFAQKLWLIHELWLGIQELREQLKEERTVNSEYPIFWSWVYRSLVHELYNSLCLLIIDKSAEVESLVKLLGKRAADKPKIANEQWAEKLVVLEKDLVREIENHPVLEKIKKYRDNVMCHLNSRLIFDDEFLKEFYEKNNPNPDEIESLLSSVGRILKKAAIRASFSPSTLPNTAIKSEIKKLFSILSQKSENLSQDVEIVSKSRITTFGNWIRRIFWHIFGTLAGKN
jgi:hypothetical protein